MKSKNIYKTLCSNEKSLPLFSQYWWLDAVCGKSNWDVVIVEKGGLVVGSMPYFIKKRLFFSLFILPPFTQILGPWIRYSSERVTVKLGNEMEIIQALLERLPNYDFFSQGLQYIYSNTLPFSWNGFTARAGYTYVLDQISDHDKLWNNLTGRARSEIRKATNRFEITIKDDCSIDDFISLYKMTFERQKKNVPHCEDVMRRIESACSEKSCRKILIAKDPNGNLHAGAYIVWDENVTYYLMGGGNPILRNSGAMSLVLWEAIKEASLHNDRFDFEGSMEKSIEYFFRSFGTTQVPYFNISKVNSKLLNIYLFIKESKF